MELRLARPEDAPGIAHVQVTTWRAAYRGIMPDAALAALSVETSTPGWRRVLADRPRGTLVACAPDGRVVGFSMLGASRDRDAAPVTGEVYAFYVVPEHWKTGTGRRLWLATRTLLREHGFTEVTLWVLEANARGRGFYERMGLVRDPAPDGSFEVAGATLPQVRYRAPLG
jgi:GNAT superfamily N-acetyltransferase